MSLADLVNVFVDLSDVVAVDFLVRVAAHVDYVVALEMLFRLLLVRNGVQRGKGNGEIKKTERARWELRADSDSPIPIVPY